MAGSRRELRRCQGCGGQGRGPRWCWGHGGSGALAATWVAPGPRGDLSSESHRAFCRPRPMHPGGFLGRGDPCSRHLLCWDSAPPAGHVTPRGPMAVTRHPCLPGHTARPPRAGTQTRDARAAGAPTVRTLLSHARGQLVGQARPTPGLWDLASAVQPSCLRKPRGRPAVAPPVPSPPVCGRSQTSRKRWTEPA